MQMAFLPLGETWSYAKLSALKFNLNIKCNAKTYVNVNENVKYIKMALVDKCKQLYLK